jgi:hypothetical protein
LIDAFNIFIGNRAEAVLRVGGAGAEQNKSKKRTSMHRLRIE